MSSSTTLLFAWAASAVVWAVAALGWYQTPRGNYHTRQTYVGIMVCTTLVCAGIALARITGLP